MGSAQSLQEEDEEEEEDDEEEEDKIASNIGTDGRRPQNTNELLMMMNKNKKKKVLMEQEPEMLPSHSSASPLSPQLSSLGTPRLQGSSIKVWDPCNVLSPPPPPPPPIPSFEDSLNVGAPYCPDLEVYLICEGESEVSVRPHLVNGRCHSAALTQTGKRQARALAVLFISQGVRFHKVYSSPLDRATSMALSVSLEMNFPREQIQLSDALVEMSLGQWEGCLQSDIFTPEVMSLVESLQPDFCAPSGESLREVEFRMVQFLNGTILRLPDRLRSDFPMQNQMECQGFPNDGDGHSLPHPSWDMLHRHRQGMSRKKSGKSRLQFVTTTGNHVGEDEMSPREEIGAKGSTSSISMCVGVFTHSTPIKCLLAGLLGCSPVMSHRFCIDDSSVTVIQHSWKTGWQIKRMNDTAHLRLL